MNNLIHPTVKLYNTKLGDDSKVYEYCILGFPFDKKGETVVGKKAIIRPYSIIYKNVNIGDDLKLGPYGTIREEVDIGNNVSIGSYSIVEDHNKIGDNVRIHTRGFVSQYTTIEKDVWIGPGVILTNDLHPPCKHYAECLRGPKIRRFAKIGAGSIIMPGVEIGEGSLIGAGSIVTRDVPAGMVAYGHPAKVRKSVKDIKCFKGFFKEVY